LTEFVSRRTRQTGDHVQHLFEFAARISGFREIEPVKQLSEHVRVWPRLADGFDHWLA